MLVGNITLDQLMLSLTGAAEASGTNTSETKEGIFDSLLAGPLKATSEKGLDNPIFKSLILKKLQNPEMSEQIKNALTSGGKISLEINNPKDILAGLISMAQEIDTNPEGISNDEATLNINIEELLKSIDVKEVVVDNQQIQQILNEFSEKLTSMLNEQLAKIETSDIKNKEEVIQFVNDLIENLTIIEQVLPKEVQVDVSNINIENLTNEELEIISDSEIPESIIVPGVQADEEILPIDLTPVKTSQETTVPREIILETEITESTSTDSKANQQVNTTSTLESIKNALNQIFEKVIDKVNSKQETRVVINTEKTSDKIDEQLLEKFSLLKNIDPENFKEIDVKVAPNPSVVNKLEAQLNKLLVNVKQVLTQELNGKELNLEKITESLKANLESIVNSTKQISENNDIKVVIPKNILKADLKPVLENNPIKSQQIEPETVKLEKLEVLKAQQEMGKTSQLDKSLQVSKVLSSNPLESIIPQSKEKDNLLDALIDKKISKLDLDKVRSEGNSNSNLFQNNSMSSDKGLFNMFLENQSDPAISGLKSVGSLFASKMMSANAATSSSVFQSPAQQLTTKIREGYGKNQIELSLNPNRLGNVKVNVAMQRGVLVASIVAETSKALESLRSGVDSLRNALIESGLNVERVIVSQADQSSNTSNNNDPNNQSKENNSPSHNNKNGNESNQQKADEFKDTMEFIQTKQAQNPSQMDRTLTGNSDNQNIDSNLKINQTATTDENYINTEKGFVNYRV